MARAERPFIRVPWSFREHPKTEEMTDAAVGQLVKAWLYCAQNETDGAVTSTQARKLFSPTVLRQLLTVGYIYADGDGYVMHEYAEHQMTKATRTDLHKARAAAGSAGGKAKAARQQSASKPVASATANSQQILAEVEEELEEEQLQEQLPSSSATPQTDSPPMLIPMIAIQSKPEPDRFEEFWKAYPKTADKAAAHRKWVLARRRVSQQTMIDAAVRYRDDPNRDPGFTKNGATWLHNDAWNNPPEPNRGSGRGPADRPSMTDSVTRTLDRGAALQARADAARNAQSDPYRTAIA